MGLVEAAQLLRLPYQQTHRLILIGKLRGRRRGSRWFVRSADVLRLARRRARQVDNSPNQQEEERNAS
jgi:hypothetical protein